MLRSAGRVTTITLLVLLVACGGGKAATPARDTAVVDAGTPTTAPATGATHDVKMIGDANGYRFDPANVTIRAGDAVRWTNVSGGPHNVSFWADSMPAGAAAQLGAQMPNTTDPLIGPLLVEPNAAYTVAFAGLAPGVYHYYCTPHLALGMRGTITVRP
ncbi:MAG TPA: plastocyanin/azurin family copper-binding protein [Gemmatirosa sp.]